MAATPYKLMVGLGDNQVEVEITPLRNRARARASIRLFKLVGPILARAIAKGGIEINGKVVKFSTMVAVVIATDDETDKEKTARMGRVQLIAASVIQEVLRAIEDLEPDDLLALGDDVLLGHCTVGKIPMVCEQTDPEARAQLAEAYADDLFPDSWAYLDAIRQAITLNILPSFGRRMSADSSTAETEEPSQPAA